MNNVILMGRLTRDPEVRYTQPASGEPMAIARFTLAVDRPKGQDREQSADFISCVSFGKTAEIAEKYLRQASKIAIEGRIQTGSYTNKDGVKIYTTEVVVNRIHFCESKNSSETNADSAPADRQTPPPSPNDGFMSIPEGIEDELPFK